MVFTPDAFEEYGRRYQHHGWTPFNYGDLDLCLLEYSIEGRPIAGVLGMHRDDEPWRRANGDAFFLECGPAGAFDESLVAMTHNPPFRAGDRLLFHYNGRRYTSKGRSAHMGLASLRLDGFASLSADDEFLRAAGKPAMLITWPLEVREPELQLNIAGHDGTARVALLDEAMNPLSGFQIEHCLPIAADAVRAPVRWRERSTLAELRGRRVHLFIEMGAGQLFAVRL